MMMQKATAGLPEKRKMDDFDGCNLVREFFSQQYQFNT
jgi:hypothetical protein